MGALGETFTLVMSPHADIVFEETLTGLVHYAHQTDVSKVYCEISTGPREVHKRSAKMVTCIRCLRWV